jgi:hypothetical protein
MTTIILNLTTNHWFSYNKGWFSYFNHINEYNRIMSELLTPLNQYECICINEVGGSFWEKTDKIIIVPAHLNAFVMKHYNQIFV